jgi:LAS superfamily LD-carboxypeptidase LdcB
MDTSIKFRTPAGRIPLNERCDPDPAELVSINKYGDSVASGQRVFQLTKTALDAFRALRTAACAAGFDRELFTLTSAYRSSLRQAQLAAAARLQYGAGASKWVAQTRSEHITGRAFDLNLGLDNTSTNAKSQLFSHTKAFQWLKANAANYGLNPYYEEPWHWSYNVKQ